MPHAEPRPLTVGLLHGWALPLRGTDKIGRGTALVVGGSAGTPGAALLAGTAALRMGAGRLQVAVPADVAVALAVVLPEAKVVGWPLRADGTMRPRRTVELLRLDVGGATSVLVGPGMVELRSTVRLLEHLAPLLAPTATLVLDAIALAALPRVSPSTLAALRDRLVLTPNLTELGQLAGRPLDGTDLTRTLAEVAERFGAAVTCHTTIGAPDGRAWSCTDGGVSLGTSGSGDVLAGLIVGAAARGAEPAQAAAWGTYVHAQAGRRLGQRLGPLSVLAREIADEAAWVMADLDTSGG